MAKIAVFSLLTALVVSAAVAEDWKSLKIRYGLLNAFHDIPLTQAELLEDDYSLMVHDDELNVDFYAYKEDPRVSIGVDSYGNIAGVRVSFIKADLPLKAIENGVTFNYTLEDKPMFKSATYYGHEVFYNTALFASPETLLAGGRQNTSGLVADDVHVRMNGVWSVLPKNECDATAASFVKEGCFPGMGLHYFYSSVACQDIQGVFGLYESGALIGLGFTTFGSQTDGEDRTWMESLSTLAVRIILPQRPSCLIDWTRDFGITSVHMFFKEWPITTLCLDGDTQC